MKVVALAVSLFGTLAVGAVAVPTAATVSSISTVLALSPEQALAHLPFCGTGVVTFVSSWSSQSALLAPLDAPNAPAVFVGGGGEVLPLAELVGTDHLRKGQIVAVNGRVDEGAFAPSILAHRLEVIGTMELPPVPDVTLHDLAWGCGENRRVRLKGTLVAVESGVRGKFTTLRLADADGVFLAHVAGDWKARFDQTIDGEVAVSGAAMSLYNQRAEFVGVQLEVATVDDVEVLRPPSADPFDAPSVTDCRVLSYSATPPNFHRVKVAGTVTLASGAGFFYLQDVSGAGIKVFSPAAGTLAVGDQVEAVGFPERNSGGFAVLVNGLVRRTGHTEPSDPLVLSIAKILRMHLFLDGKSVNYDACLVRVTGRLSLIGRSGGETELRLADAGESLRVYLDGELPEAVLRDIELEPLVTLSGVCEITLESGLPAGRIVKIEHAAVRLRTADDITITPDADWLARRNTRRWAVASVWVLAAALCIVVALLVKMAINRRRRVRMTAVLEERKRMAADLHDTIEQYLSGARLMLKSTVDSCTDLPTAAAEPMKLAAELLAEAKSEVRAIVWNLRSDALHDQSLADALHTAGAAAAKKLGIAVTCRLDTLPAHVPAARKVELLFIVNEAITNAVKHGGATEVRLIARDHRRGGALEIVNNGRPFDPDAAQGVANGHFGIAGMRERARKIGATLTLASAPGRTVVRVAPLTGAGR